MNNNKESRKIGLSINEMEFLAENEIVRILPRFRFREIKLLTGTYGPFRPQVQTAVPLWLAITFKKQQKCNIIPPEWMAPDNLREIFDNEKREVRDLQTLPYHYLEVATLLFECAEDDIENSDQTRMRVEDIRNIRAEKIRSLVKAKIKEVGEDREEEGRVLPIDVSSFGAMETTTIMPYYGKCLETFHSIKTVGDEIVSEDSSVRARSATSRASFGGGFNFNSNRNAAGADYDDGYDTGRGNRNLKFMER